MMKPASAENQKAYVVASQVSKPQGQIPPADPSTQQTATPQIVESQPPSDTGSDSK